MVILIADARHTQTRNDTMPFVLDGLNMIFLAAAAIFGGTIIKANPDLTKPHPDSAFGKWQAKRQEKVSHETSPSLRGCFLRVSRRGMRGPGEGRAIDPAIPACPVDVVSRARIAQGSTRGRQAVATPVVSS